MRKAKLNTVWASVYNLDTKHLKRAVRRFGANSDRCSRLARERLVY